MPSTQWSTARMPVDRNSHSGVCTVRAGSRITARGITSSWRSISLTLIRALVTPAMALNSPPAIVVGTLIWRTVGAFIGGATPLWTRILSISSTVRTLLARQSCTALAPSVIEPPPTVTIRSAPAARACSAAAMTASRGVCGGIASKVATQREPKCFSNFFDLGGLPVERAADHEKPAGSAQAVHLRDDRLGSGVAENHLVHGTENDTPPVHDACPPGTLWFCYSLGSNLAE